MLFAPRRPFSPTPHDPLVVNIVVSENPVAEPVPPHDSVLREAVLLGVDLDVLGIGLSTVAACFEVDAELRVLKELGGLLGAGAVLYHGEGLWLGCVRIYNRFEGRDVELFHGDAEAAPDSAVVEDPIPAVLELADDCALWKVDGGGLYGSVDLRFDTRLVVEVVSRKELVCLGLGPIGLDGRTVVLDDEGLYAVLLLGIGEKCGFGHVFLLLSRSRRR